MMLKVKVYSDQGAGPISIQGSIALFRKLEGVCVKTIKATEVIDGSWMSDCDIFVMPGGRDIPYDRALRGEGNQNIRSFVENGGTYVGFCAGAYYGAKDIVFEEGEACEVIESRELGFFPGKAIGAINFTKKFDYLSYDSATMVEIEFLKKEYLSFYYGGCYFEKASEFDNVDVLASYKKIDQPAIVDCQVGLGRAILSGVHFEVEPHFWDKWHPLYQTLLKEEKSRLRLVGEFLNIFT